MYMKELHKIWLATGDRPIYLEPAMTNCHGLIAGATGTGKTVTLKVVAESFGDMGAPVFLADIKGDLSGMCLPGCKNKYIRRSIDTMGITGFDYTSYPVRFFDVYGRQGHPVRTTISEMGPELLSRLLGLNETQSDVLRIVFRIADDQGLLLIDLKDLRSMVQYMGDNAKEYKLTYGNISSQSVGAVQWALLALEDEGGDIFFGEPALDIADWVDWAEDGRGVMNILECQELFRHPPCCTPHSCCGCSPNCTKCFPRREIWTSPSWPSPLTRPTFSSVMHPRCCWKRWSKWCGSSAPRVSACGLSPRIPATFQTASWSRSATGSSMHSGPTRPTTRKPSGLLPGPFG